MIKIDTYESQQNLIKGIKILIQNELNSLAFNRQSIGVLKELYSTYAIVEINGQTYKCRIKADINLAVGDIVVVVIPNNDFNLKYVDGKLL